MITIVVIFVDQIFCMHGHEMVLFFIVHNACKIVNELMFECISALMYMYLRLAEITIVSNNQKLLCKVDSPFIFQRKLNLFYKSHWDIQLPVATIVLKAMRKPNCI